MIRCLTFKLLLGAEDAAKLLDTMREYTKVFNLSAIWGFEHHTWNKVENHKATYRIARDTSKLPSSLVQGARDCACEALKAVKCETLPKRKSLAAMRYNHRVITANLKYGIATVSTVEGRVKATFTVPEHFKQYLSWTIRSSTISYRGEFYIHVSLETVNPAIDAKISVLGIDRGIRNIAVCSNNKFFNNKKVKNTRAHYAKLRKELQAKGTRSANRKLKKISGRERRFVANVNHIIAKAIIAMDYTVFALEDLRKIRVQKRRSKELNRKLNNWSFYQLEHFLQYNAEAIGKRVILVDSRYTSQKCSNCSHTYKGNREGASFRCRKCGFKLDADLNAARNIAQAGISSLGRLYVNQPNVACL